MMYRRLQRLGGRVRRLRWSSSKSTPTGATKQTTVGVSTRSTPGTVRVTKGYGADKHEAELDSTLARIIGSDWGDRSHQPVSMPMRIYWVIFTVVLGNGLYTYFAGKDESFLVEKLKKKADEKLGIEEEGNEFEEMATAQKSSSNTVVKSENEEKKQVTAPQKLGMPFLGPGVSPQTNARRTKSKTELEQQLTQLNLQQERLLKQIRSGGEKMKEDLDHQVRMIDVQKEQIERMIKNL